MRTQINFVFTSDIRIFEFKTVIRCIYPTILGFSFFLKIFFFGFIFGFYFFKDIHLILAIFLCHFACEIRNNKKDALNPNMRDNTWYLVVSYVLWNFLLYSSILRCIFPHFSIDDENKSDENN